MTVPQLTRKLVLEAPNRQADGSGGFDMVWEPLGILWAEVTARTGDEIARADAPISAMRYRIVVRGAPFGAPQRPKPEQRFRENQRTFRIQAVAEEDPAGRYLTCFATEERAV